MSAPIWTRFTENYFRYPVDYSLMDQFNLTANVVRQVEALCREDAYNIVAYKHLGDVFYFLGAKEALEKTFGGKVHYILLPQHEFLAKLWNITDYSTFPLDKLVKKTRLLSEHSLTNRILILSYWIQILKIFIFCKHLETFRKEQNRLSWKIW